MSSGMVILAHFYSKGLMATLCADPSVDIQLRLQLLETLELRSLGWRRHPAMADYYRCI